MPTVPSSALRLEERRIDQDRRVHAGRNRRGLRLRRRVDDGDAVRLRIGVAELEAQHLRQHVVGIAAEQRADGLALQVGDVADRRILARREHEAEVAFADGDDLQRLVLRDQAHDRRVAPHAEIEVARDERLDHRRGRRVVAVVDGEVVAGVRRVALERLVGDHVLRDRRVAGGPRLASDRDLERLASPARARSPAPPCATDAAPAAAMNRRRDAPLWTLSMDMLLLLCCGQVTVARYASSRIRLQMCCASAWNSGCARVASLRGRGRGTSISAFRRPGMRGHHGDAVGEEHGLVDRVRDEHDGAPLARRAGPGPRCAAARPAG